MKRYLYRIVYKDCRFSVYGLPYFPKVMAEMLIRRHNKELQKVCGRIPNYERWIAEKACVYKGQLKGQQYDYYEYTRNNE